MLSAKVQNIIGGSAATLPLCAIMATALWWLPQRGYSPSYLIAFILCAVTTYVIAETNNVNALIRVRSRMVSSMWLILMACIGFLHEFQPYAISALCLAVSYYLLFRTYQEVQPVADTLHIFIMLGVGSIFVPHMIVMAPLYYWYMLVFLRSLTFRCFWAGLIGLALPFWFWAGLCLWNDDYQPMFDWWSTLSTLHPIVPDNYLAMDHPLAICWIVVALMAIYTGLQYLNNSFNDKIRVRMLFYIYIFQSTVILLLAALQPQHALMLLPLMLVSCSPFIAHYFTLTRTWWCTFCFWFDLLLITGMAILTLTPWLEPYMKYLTIK